MPSPTTITLSAVPPAEPLRCAYVTFLLTSPSYLPGILLLAHTLRHPTTEPTARSAYPLIVAVNPALPGECVKALEEAGVQVRRVEPLVPRGRVTTIAERFVDTWTKLRVWGMEEYDRLILIDGDMMIRQNMDELFHMPLAPDQIACAHACVCNLDHSSWAPEDWTRENCAYTPTHHPDALTAPVPASGNPRPHLLLNSGLVVLTPSRTTMDRITALLSSDDPAEQELVASWMFPDQDLLAEVFKGKWQALPWCYNALKTMRYWHGNFWRDEEIRNVHYICDKPWKRRPERKAEGDVVDADTDAPANPLNTPINPASRYTCNPGRFLEIHDAELGLPAEEADAVTHGWWWDAYEQMHDRLVKEKYGSLEYLESLVGK